MGGGVQECAGVAPGAAARGTHKKRRLKQYFSGIPLARMMASMMDYSCTNVKLLDPGAGSGQLFAACVERACGLDTAPRSISITAYELDRSLKPDLDAALDRSRELCVARGVRFAGEIMWGDFVADSCGLSRRTEPGSYTHVIMNPPYGKLGVSSDMHGSLRHAGIRVPNTYAAFIAVSQGMLRDGGQMAFISPRSFCNGRYFGRFRLSFLESMALRRIHLFGSRTAVFSDDDVLQETVVVCAERRGAPGMVHMTTSPGPLDKAVGRLAPVSEALPAGPGGFMHVVCDEAGARVSRMMRGMPCTLDGLGLQASTGGVVDFRVRDHLREGADQGTVPLVRPHNMRNGVVDFPAYREKHPGHIMDNGVTRSLLVPNGTYVLVNRTTSSEENRRVVAAVWTGLECDASWVGFENRTNYIHRNGGGLDMQTATGLCAFLNSNMVDSYFRQFNGSTHVNASDLRYLKYPSMDKLLRLGAAAD